MLKIGPNLRKCGEKKLDLQREGRPSDLKASRTSRPSSKRRNVEKRTDPARHRKKESKRSIQSAAFSPFEKPAIFCVYRGSSGMMQYPGDLSLIVVPASLTWAITGALMRLAPPQDHASAAFLAGKSSSGWLQ